jgi:glycosyltransferase involved in cell wall biosynthesis
MRILLIGNYALDNQESMLRFAALMERELKARGHTVRLMQPQAHLAKATGGVGKWLGYLDKLVLFPFALKHALREFDVVHICDHSNAFYTKYLANIPNVVTCHDVLAIRSALGEIPQNTVSSTGRMLQRMILNGLRLAQYVVCVSSISREEMLRVTGRHRESSEVVHLSLSYPYSPMAPEQALERLDALGYDARLPFFLHVGGATWYKNRMGLLEIFNHLQQKLGPEPARLLLVGGSLEPELAAYIARSGLEGKVTLLQGLSNEDLRAVYSLAEALIFPSLQEGFGWPVLEAQACGCPVFATGREPMTEIGGDAAIYFDPEDTTAAASIITESLPGRAEIRRKGLANLSRFTVSQMVDGYERAYDLVHQALPTDTRRG